MIKVVKLQKKSQLKYYQEVPYTTKNLLLLKDILKTLTTSGINNFIRIGKDGILETTVKELEKIEKENSSKKRSSSVVFIEPYLWCKNIVWNIDV